MGVPLRPYVPVSKREVVYEEGRRDMTLPPLLKKAKSKLTLEFLARCMLV